MAIELSQDERAVIAKRHDDRIGVPVDLKRAPPDLLAGFQSLKARKLVTWIDRFLHREAGLVLDVYLIKQPAIDAFEAEVGSTEVSR